MWLDDVDCTGDEDRFEDCRHSGLGVENCRPSDNVGLICVPGNIILYNPR